METNVSFWWFLEQYQLSPWSQVLLFISFAPFLCCSWICCWLICLSALLFPSAPVGEVSSENFLDYKNRGVNGSHRGQIIWKIDASSYFVECEYSHRSCGSPKHGWSRIQLYSFYSGEGLPLWKVPPLRCHVKAETGLVRNLTMISADFSMTVAK